MRVGVPLLRRKRGALSRRRSGRDDGEPELHPLSAARGGSGGDAMEFFVFAGAAVCPAGVYGRGRWAPEARLDFFAKGGCGLGNLSGGPGFRQRFSSLSG